MRQSKSHSMGVATREWVGHGEARIIKGRTQWSGSPDACGRDIHAGIVA